MTAPRLLLIRHGRSSHVNRDGWLNLDGMRRWREGYDAAGIVDTHDPPPRLVDEVAHADLLVASDLPRAIGSAKRLAPKRDIVISSIVREAPQPMPRWMPLRIPHVIWHALITGTWFWQIVRGTDASPEDLARAATAAAWLTRQASEHGTVAVVTHGVFRRLVGHRLVAEGWKAEPRRGGYRHWSVWPFTLAGGSH